MRWVTDPEQNELVGGLGKISALETRDKARNSLHPDWLGGLDKSPALGSQLRTS